MSRVYKGEEYKKRGWKQVQRFVASGFLVCLFFAIPFKQARAVPVFCDACVVSEIGFMDADLGGELGFIDGDLVATNILLGTTDVLLTTIEADLLDPLFGLPAIEFALYGDFPPNDPAQGDFGIDIDMNGGFAAVVEALDTDATESAPMVGQVGADATLSYNDGQGMANETPAATVAKVSIHGATAYALNMRSVMEGFTNAMAAQMTDVVLIKDTGANSNTGSNTAAQVACEMAPFRTAGAGSPRLSPQVLAALATCPPLPGGVAPPNDLLDADFDIGSVFDRIQFFFPSDAPTFSPNNHIIFTPEDEDGDSGEGEWRFVAAWRYCEHYAPGIMAPPTSANTNMTMNMDLPLMISDASGMVTKLPALEECMKELADRTACVQAGGNNPEFTVDGTANVTCWQVQNVACHRLTDPPPSGLGLQDVGNEEVNAALANCDDNGLSLRAFNYALAHRCNDPNFMGSTVSQEYADVTKVRQEAVFCEKDRNAFEVKLQQEKNNFLEAVSLLM